MIKCVFICDIEIIDANFYSKLQWAIGEVIKEHDVIDFLFVDENKLCLDAVLEARLENPDKHIQITIVGATHACYLPDCAWDRKLETPLDMDNIYPWVVNQCDFIIYYHYDDLNVNNRPYGYARRSNSVLFDLSQPNACMIQKCVAAYLDESDQRLKTLLDSGMTYAAIARDFGLSHQAIRIRAKKLVKKLTAYVKYEKQKTELESSDDPQSHPIVCSLLDFDPQCNEQRSKRIRQAVRFVISHHKNCLFLVEREMCESEFVETVCRAYPFGDENWNIEICLAEHRAEGEEIVASHASQKPFYGTLHFDTKTRDTDEQRRRIWSMMLTQSDFALCSGEGSEARLAALQAASGYPRAHLPRLKVLNVNNGVW